jgi:hypothetical protein
VSQEWVNVGPTLRGGSVGVPLGHKVNVNPISDLLDPAASEARVGRFGFKCEDGERNLVDAPERFAARDTVESVFA